MIYIILPPELSKRSIQTLIQYMYSGEATVSNDILNEVLRGGEVLKIRGLWRNNQTSEPNASSTPQYQTAPPPKMGGADNNFSHSKENQIMADKPPIYDHRPDRMASASNTAVIKESPVIVMSPRQCHAPTQLPPQLTVTQRPQSDVGGNTTVQNAPIKKETLLESDSNVSHFGLVSVQAAVKKSQSSTAADKRIRAPMDGTPQHENGSEPIRRYSDEHTINNENIISPSLILRENEMLRMADKRRISVSEAHRAGHHLDPGEKNRFSNKIAHDNKSPNEIPIPEALSFFSIKQEPLEWSEYDHDTAVEKPPSQIELTVKPEIMYGHEDESEEEGN